MKSVVIVGAGPAGLVAAKTLLHSTPGKFNVTILEQQDRVGGMWALRKGDTRGKFSPEMLTNLSRFTVAFSDLSWSCVDIRDDPGIANGKEDHHIPMFPKAWQVGRYLETYAKKYIPREIIHLDSRVTKAERIVRDGASKWNVEWMESPYLESQILNKFSKSNSVLPRPGNSTHSSCFDYLIVGSGFFSSPRPLALDPLEDSVIPPSFPPKLQHSSEFRTLADLLPHESDLKGSIVVIGGSISGSEAAANVAFQLSNAKYAPLPQQNNNNCKVYHVFTRPFYCLPRYLPQNPYSPETQNYNLAPTFLPLDFCMYNLSRRAEGPIYPSHGRMPPDRAAKSHRFIREMLGGDQRDLGRPEMVYSQQQQGLPAYTGIVDMYAEFVRSGAIVPVRGRVSQLRASTEFDLGTNSNKGMVKAISEPPWDVNGQDTKVINDVIGVVYATGFTPQPSISWLSQEVREALECADNSPRLPVLFQRHSIFNDHVPNIAFIGFYEGPFWGVMEMQARLVANKWALLDDQNNLNSLASPGEESEKELAEMRALRDAMTQHAEDVPQFWMNDYVGLMEGCAKELGLRRDDSGWDGRNGPCIAARYTATGCDVTEANSVVSDARELVEAAVSQGRFVAVATFRAMQGKWVLRRRLDSRLPGFPSGTFTGSANFHPRSATDPTYATEYLYIEEGTLKTDTGLTLQANRRYVYRYNETTDKISSWFVKDDGRTVDYFFNEVQFQMPTPDTKAQGKGWVANGAHLCEADMYESFYEFRFRGASLDCFCITYEVKGPKKDYTSETWYER
ncbi:nucleotide-binding domain-containing protein [Lepidopterella palustris CBS 459.81]|uniref:Nucleotide-binding domain-containing protein n=1 Tax=Lepidopterella palustris CBS 459.81 TaxID=1314670 RepID=A0A8E2E829_9PEZI|nr:nucleotide-binding domain-containing protein [Lepidopterella palustris CBS 459.81]